MKALFGWFDDRTGYKLTVHEILYENIPGGSRWRYVSGSMLVFAFVTQMITGLFLWMGYSPGAQNAWESVYYIQNEMQGGWLLRGMHHYMSHAMVMLLPLHMLQVIVDKAYKPPREINFWLGLVLMLIVLAMSLTGYLLPWDQKGYWATKVATNLMSLAPGGPQLQKLVVGGSDYGQLTLTRFFALHAGLLPALLVFFLVLHVGMFRKHGITAEKSEKRPDQFFWPYQLLKDSIACLVLLLVVLLFVIHWDVRGLLTADLPIEHRGAELSAPADPAELYSAARPETYFLFLFQLLKKFKSEFIGAIVLPTAVMVFLFAMPLVSRVKWGHVVNLVVFLSLLIGAGYLTAEAMHEDNYATWHQYDPQKYPQDAEAQKHYEHRFEASRSYLAAVEQGKTDYERIRELIGFYGIPRSGAITLQRNDPETQGPRLFARHCASCHSHVDENGEGIAAAEPSAPNLYGIATRTWLKRFLSSDEDTGITSHHFFGNTEHRDGDMVEFVKSDLAELDSEKQAQLDQMIAALSAEARLVSQKELDSQARQKGTIDAGKEAFATAMGDYACTDCHKFHDLGDLGSAPDLTGYGSYEWLHAFISDPSHDRFYSTGNDRMPAFANNPDAAEKNLLTEHEIDMLVRWLRGDDRDLSKKLPAPSLEIKTPETLGPTPSAPPSPKLATAAPQAAPPKTEVVESPGKNQPTPAKSPKPATVDAPASQPATARAVAARSTANQPTLAQQPGEKLFIRHCARCHAHVDHQGQGIAGPKPRPDGSPNGAPNLHGFASRSWLDGLLDPEQIISPHYFGATAHAQKDENGDFREGGMVQFVHDNLVGLDEPNRAALSQVIAALSAEAELPSQRDADESARNDGTLVKGRDALVNNFGCIDCHRFHDDGDLGYAPDLTGYGSREWLTQFIANPEGERFYPDSNDRMPAFAPNPDVPERNRLTLDEIDILARWIRGEPYDPSP